MNMSSKKEQLIREFTKYDASAVPAMADATVRNAQEPFCAAVELWRGDDPELAQKAHLFLARSKELAIRPLAEANYDVPVDGVMAISMAVDAEVELRKALALKVDAMLGDKTMITYGKGPGAEEVPAPRRMCDEAYEQMLRLVHLDRDEYSSIVEMRRFLQLPDDKKDQIIRDARLSPAWVRMLEGE